VRRAKGTEKASARADLQLSPLENEHFSSRAATDTYAKGKSKIRYTQSINAVAHSRAALQGPAHRRAQRPPNSQREATRR